MVMKPSFVHPTVFEPNRRAVLGGIGTACALPAITSLDAASAEPSPTAAEDWFVDPNLGNDDWTGRQPAPGDDDAGPLATIDEAIDRAVAEAEELAVEEVTDEPIRIWLRGGRYERRDRLELSPFPGGVPLDIAAYPDETPVIDGTTELTGWTETTINGVTAWHTHLPTVEAGHWRFNQLFVDGERRPRPRFPAAVDEVFEDGEPVESGEPRFYHVVDAPDEAEARTFVAEPDSIDPDWRNLEDVEVIALTNWYDERSTIEDVDSATDEVTIAHRSYPADHIIWSSRFYYLENVFEALERPGQWYLDRSTGDCYYVPRSDETIEDVSIRAPRAHELLVVTGTGGEPVRNVTFRGLTFHGTAWRQLRNDPNETTQSAFPAAEAIRFRHAERCALRHCRIHHVGEYGIGLHRRTRHLEVTGCELADLGAGGIKVYGSRTRRAEMSRQHRITDNHLHHGGRVFHMGAGVLSTTANGMTIGHNHIHDFYYTGISCGFTWGFGGAADENRIEANHIHDLGHGLLSDMGGVYTLGKQPATEVRYNHIHDVNENDYGGWGLYPDEGSTGIRWIGNLVYGTQNAFHMHFGADNLVHNNVLAAPREATVAYSNHDPRGESDVGLRLFNNVLVTDDDPIFTGGYGWDLGDPGVESDENLLWNESGDLDVSDDRQRMRIIRTSDDEPVPGSEVIVDLGDGEEGEFVFATLPEPIELAAESEYRLVIEGESGGAPWYDPVAVESTDDASVIGSTWYSGTEGAFQDATNGAAFGPVNLRYRTEADDTERPVLETPTPDTDVRNDHDGAIGTVIATGEDPLTVTALGQLVPPIESWWDQWTALDRDGESVVADPLFEDDGYTLGDGSPAFEPPVSLRPLPIDRAGPRDVLPPRPPTDVTASGDESVEIAWGDVPGAAQYRVYGAEDGQAAYERVDEVDESVVTVSLDAGETAGYVVTSLDTDGTESLPSARVDVTVPTATDDTPADADDADTDPEDTTADEAPPAQADEPADDDAPPPDESDGRLAVVAAVVAGLAGLGLLARRMLDRPPE